MSIGSGVLLPAVVKIPPFPILRPLAYTTGLGYRPTCDVYYIILYYKKTSNICVQYCGNCDAVHADELTDRNRDERTGPPAELPAGTSSI